MFITLEGIDGAGKSTQFRLLKNYFEENTISSFFIKSDSAFDGVKEKILDNYGHIDPIAVFLLTLAKHKVVEMNVVKQETNYEYVIVDRYIDTSLAYTKANINTDNKMDFTSIQNELVKLYKMPDITILIDTPPEIAIERKNQLGFDRIEFGNSSFKLENKEVQFIKNQNDARNCYLQLARQYANRYHIIDGTSSIEKIHKEIIERINL